MSEPAIRAEGLGKCYRLGRGGARYETLRDRLAQLALRPLHRVSVAVRRDRRGGAVRQRSEPDLLWALKNISFEVGRGDAIGVVGRNGAGKSTLLKILSRITEPTEGRATVHGRLSSLLEVGTGFHPELTGRENVFLNGAILGMKRAEIHRRFDEIVAFAEVERFVDTPVKHYSSGMYLRLAFAVAAHLEPEILVVDEVLAVGDASFQRKCIDKMDATAREGRTVVFVSHNLSAVMRLCPTAMLLENGRIAEMGPATGVVERYLQAQSESTAEKVWRAPAAPGAPDEPVRPLAMRVRDATGHMSDSLRSTQPFWIEIEYRLTAAERDLRASVKLYSGMGELLFISSDVDDPALSERCIVRAPGDYVSRCQIPANLLNRGSYLVGVTFASQRKGLLFNDPYALRFTVDVTGGVGTQLPVERGGYFRPALSWKVEGRKQQHIEADRRLATAVDREVVG